MKPTRQGRELSHIRIIFAIKHHARASSDRANTNMMTEDIKCPLPQSEEALVPYIHTRLEALRMRLGATDYLTSQLGGLDDSITHVELACPSPLLHTKHNASSIPDGVYASYIAALDSHHQARARHERLRKELEELAAQHVKSKAEAATARKHDALADYVSLLRQRRQRNSLTVFSDTLSHISDVQPDPISTNLRRAVKERLGDPPEPPRSLPQSKETGLKLESLTLRLKKDVLTAKHDMDKATRRLTTAREGCGGVPGPSLSTQVHALRCARDALINWMEGELAKISEDDEEAEKGNSSQVEVDRELLSPEDLQQRIDRFYATYIDSRKRLVAAISVCTSQADAGSRSCLVLPAQDDTPSMTSNDKQSTPSNVDTSQLLPFLPVLQHIASSEKALMQQQTYLGRQFSSLSASNLDLIRRLAGESHLVAPGVRSPLAWVEAAQEASRETESFVERLLIAGERDAQDVERQLEQKRRRRELLAKLIEAA